MNPNIIMTMEACGILGCNREKVYELLELGLIKRVPGFKADHLLRWSVEALLRDSQPEQERAPLTALEGGRR